MTDHAMDAALQLTDEALAKPAPETSGDDEKTVCEYCGHARLNRTMVVTGDHWLCADCDQDGDALKALTLAMDMEETVMVRAIEQAHELVERARRYRAPLHRYRVVNRAGLRNEEMDAALIAEAFTVASETGLSPRQLVEQRDAMSAALWGIRDNSTDAIASKVADDVLAITTAPEKQ